MSKPSHQTLRTAIIGCGRIAGGYDEDSASAAIRTHAKAYSLHRKTRLVAVADEDLTRAQRFSRRWGGPDPCRDPEEMLLVHMPDIVSICTPDATHLAMLELCLRSPSVKGVWCEKPLHTDALEAEEMVKAFRLKGVPLAVSYQRRWDPQMDRVKRAIHAGELGPIQKTVVYYTKGIMHNGSHAVDLLLDWLGPAGDLRVLSSHIDFSPADPTVDALLRFGDVPTYLVGLDEDSYSIFELQVFGSCARVDIRDFGRRTEWSWRSTPPGSTQHELQPPERRYRTATPRNMLRVLDNLVRAVMHGDPLRSTGDTALATLRVCETLATMARERVPAQGHAQRSRA